MHACAASHFTGSVRAAIVNDKNLDAGDSGNAPGQIRNRRGQVLSLVKAGDLDDELQFATSP